MRRNLLSFLPLIFATWLLSLGSACPDGVTPPPADEVLDVSAALRVLPLGPRDSVSFRIEVDSIESAERVSGTLGLYRGTLTSIPYYPTAGDPRLVTSFDYFDAGDDPALSQLTGTVPLGPGLYTAVLLASASRGGDRIDRLAVRQFVASDCGDFLVVGSGNTMSREVGPGSDYFADFGVNLSEAEVNPIEGQAFSWDFKNLIQGTSLPFTYELLGGVHGAPPPGLRFSSNGVLAGTPLSGSAGRHSFIFAMLDTCPIPREYRCRVTLDVLAEGGCPALSIVAEALPEATLGVPYSANIALLGGQPPLALSLVDGALPPGLTLNGLTLSGTPTDDGFFEFTLRASDSCDPAQAREATFAFVVDDPGTCPALSFPAQPLGNGAVGDAYSQPLVITGGQAPVGVSVLSGTLPPGLTLASTGLTGTPTTEGVFTFTLRASDACDPPQTADRSFTVTIGPAGSCPALSFTTAPLLPDGTTDVPYSLQLQTTGGVAPHSFALASGSVLPTGLTLSTTGLISGTVTTPIFNTNFTAEVTDSCDPPQLVSRIFGISILDPVSCSPLEISVTDLPDGTVGVAYGANLVSGGEGAMTVTVVSGALPPGLSLSNTGALSGTPTTAGVYAFGMQVVDSCDPPQELTRTINLTIVGSACDPFALIEDSPPGGRVGDAYLHPIYYTGGLGSPEFALTAGELPDGIIVQTDGVLAGTPTTEGDYTFTVGATDDCSIPQFDDVELMLHIDPAPNCDPIVFTAASGPDGLNGQPYSYTYETTGGFGGVQYSLVLGSFLPAGLTLALDGTLSGTPTETGEFQFGVQAFDQCDPNQQEFVLDTIFIE